VPPFGATFDSLPRLFPRTWFWRGCPKGYTRPKTNRASWDKKREHKMARDRRVTRQLRRQGWKVVRIWQLPSAVYAALRLSCSGISPPKAASTEPAACSNPTSDTPTFLRMLECFHPERLRPTRDDSAFAILASPRYSPLHEHAG
jgi:hypothetical protein